MRVIFVLVLLALQSSAAMTQQPPGPSVPTLPREVPAPVVTPGRTAVIQQQNAFLAAIYRLPEVQEQCKTVREVTVQIDGPGHDLLVTCSARKFFMEQAVRFYRSPDVAAECEQSPAAVVKVNLYGVEIHVDCRVRASDLALFEKWLR